MRASSAVLKDTSTRLWELGFPSSRVLLARTRGAYVHLENLIAFSKRDRDGRLDAYLTAWLPDEIVLLFFLKGEPVNASIVTPSGRFAAAIPEALRQIRSEPERCEMAFHQATVDLLAAMYSPCLQPAIHLGLDARTPDGVFRTLLDKRFTGLVELIANGRVNYLQVREGRFSSGHFADRHPNEPPTQAVARLFVAQPGALPKVTANCFEGLGELPVQASPAMVQMFRNIMSDLTERAEQEAPEDGARRAEKVRARLLEEHEVLRHLSTSPEGPVTDPIVSPAELAAGMAAWTQGFLEELEVMYPKIAPRLIREAAREHRFSLAALGFFDRIPWTVTW